MGEDKKRKALRRYFKPPRLTTFFILLVLGVVGALVWLVFALIRVSRSPDDQEVDRWFKEDEERITGQSFDKLELDKDHEDHKIRDPIFLGGPILWETNGVDNKDLLFRKGRDKVVRFAVNRVIVLHFTKIAIAAYEGDFNSLKNVMLNERTDEYHFQDIVSVSTQESSSSYTLPNGNSLVHSQSFRISVPSGESIECVIGSEKLSKITGGTIPTTKAENAIKAIRLMLRERKAMKNST